MAISADSCVFRFVILFFNCMLTFGSYFCFDMPSVLQGQFQGNSTPCAMVNILNVTNTSLGNFSDSCCVGCLGMSPQDYNLLYAVYAWTNAFVVIGAGFLIDKVGNRAGLFLFSFLVLTGSCTFASGVFLRNTEYLLPVMLIGRLLFGAGNGSLTIVQNRITAYWFKDKELAMAFGITLAFSRLGSVLNFFLTSNFVEAYGLQWTLWGGAILCFVGFLSAIILSFLDRFGVRLRGEEAGMKSDAKKLKFTDIKHFGLQYWLLALTIMFFYNGVFPFVADSTEFISNKYGYSKKTSSYITGAVYDISMLLSPFLGFVIDYFGKRAYLALGCALATIPVFGLLAFSTVYPLVMTLWLGFTYSFAAPSTWPSIPLVVKQESIGTAMGVTTSLQMIGIGISNLVVGKILGKSENIPKEEKLQRWKYVMIFLLANTLACVATTIIQIIVDKKKDNVLNQSKWEREAKRRLALTRKQGSARSSSYEDESESEPSETDVLLPGPRSLNYTD